MAKAKKCKLGKMYLFIEKESWLDEANIPTYAVEHGIDISDHIEDRPNEVTLTGIIYSDNKHTIAEKINGLKKYKNTGIRLTYVGRRTGTNFLIRKFSYDSEVSIANGHSFSLSLQEIRIAKKYKKTKKKSAKGKSNGGRKQTSNSKSKKYHITRSGDTYWVLARKYGTTWQQLQKWNKYPPKRIPIGVKLKVR
ncbi:LysM peptidoglycan-binding domain-containing protein [Rummeliibacillus sp. BSL5]